MIRKATTDDIPDMVALQKFVEGENSISGYRADTPEVWGKRDLAWTMVATSDGKTKGFIHCHPKPYSGECIFPIDSRILEIVDLVIEGHERSRGLGHQLVARIRRQAPEEGFTHLRAYSAAKRFDDILKFYRTCGFQPWYLEMTQEIGAELAGTDDA